MGEYISIIMDENTRSMMEHITEQILTIADAAEVLHLSTMRTRNLLSEQKAIFEFMGRQCTTRQAVDLLIEDRQAKATATAIARDEKEAERDAAKAAKKDAGPTWIEVRYLAKQAGIKIGSRPKDEVVEQLRAEGIEI